MNANINFTLRRPLANQRILPNYSKEVNFLGTRVSSRAIYFIRNLSEFVSTSVSTNSLLSTYHVMPFWNGFTPVTLSEFLSCNVSH